MLVAFNLTGVPVIEDNSIESTSTNDVQHDDDGDDYYLDPEQSGDAAADSGTPTERNGYIGNAVHRVEFVIDDTVEPGMYRGRIYNGDEGTVSAVVKGMINVAMFDESNSGDYIVDDTEDDAGRYSFFFLYIYRV